MSTWARWTIDHGKTTLTAAITKVLSGDQPEHLVHPFDQIDRRPKRSSAASPSRSPRRYETANRHYAHVDMPGHADYSRTYHRRASRRAILVVSAADGPMPQTREHVLLAASRRPLHRVALNKLTRSTTRSSWTWSSSRCASCSTSTSSRRRHPDRACQRPQGLEGDPEWTPKILELMDAVDTYSRAERDVPSLLMPVEDSCPSPAVAPSSPQGGAGHRQRRRRGRDRGLRDTQKTTVTGSRCPQAPRPGQAGDNIAPWLRGTKKEDVERARCCASGLHHPTPSSRAPSTSSTRTRWPPQAVLQQLPTRLFRPPT